MPIRLAAELADLTQKILINAQASSGQILFNPETFLSDDRIFEVAKYALRDLQRIEYDQKNRVAISKYAAYVGFWFAKLKPINTVYLVSDGTEPGEREIEDINERVVLTLIDRILLKIAYVDPDVVPAIWKNCEIKACSREFSGHHVAGACYFAKNRRFLTGFEGRHSDYIVYCLRFRSVSPYFLVNYIDQSLQLSCEHAFPPMFAK